MPASPGHGPCSDLTLAGSAIPPRGKTACLVRRPFNAAPVLLSAIKARQRDVQVVSPLGPGPFSGMSSPSTPRCREWTAQVSVRACCAPGGARANTDGVRNPYAVLAARLSPAGLRDHPSGGRYGRRAAAAATSEPAGTKTPMARGRAPPSLPPIRRCGQPYRRFASRSGPSRADHSRSRPRRPV